MSISDGFAGSVGNTPLIRLRAVSEETGCEILGKAEEPDVQHLQAGFRAVEIGMLLDDLVAMGCQ